jgi:hypothetical protein
MLKKGSAKESVVCSAAKKKYMKKKRMNSCKNLGGCGGDGGAE